MASAFTQAQFMSPPTFGGVGAVPLGAVKAGSGIEILADGTINSSAGGGTVDDIVVSNGIQGGGQGPQVFLGLLPPAGTNLGGVKTLPGSGISIDVDGVIRSVTNYTLTAGIGLNVVETGSESATVSLNAAGTTAAARGGVYLLGGFNGLRVAVDGELTVAPASSTVLGGVKQGSGVTILPDGTLNATGSGGTITGVGTGVGLGGGGTTGAVTIFQRPAGFGGATNIGGVYAGDNITIAADGRISLAPGTGVATVTGTAPVQVTGTNTNPIIGVDAASTIAPGIVQLSNSTSTTNSTLAATPTAVKSAYDLANAALSKAGGSMTGAITFTGGQTFPNTVNSGAFTQTGGLLVGDTSPPGYAQLPVGTNGQILTANSAAPLGVEWQTSLSNPTLQTVTAVGATTNIATTFQGSTTFGEQNLSTKIDGRSIGFFTVGTAEPLIKIDNQPGGSQAVLLGVDFLIQSPPGGSAILLGNRVPAQGSLSVNGNTALNLQLNSSTKVVLNSTGFSVNTQFRASNIKYPLADGTANQVLITDGAGQLEFSSNFLSRDGGSMNGDIFFTPTQTFPRVVATVGAGAGILAGGTATNPIISATTATTSALGVVQPDGTTITINGSGVISSVGGMSNPMTTLGDIIYASATGTPATPARLGLGAAGTILAVNGTGPAWRTSVQLGLLTAAAAATTYAPINSPVFTGPATVTSGGAAGSNALTVSGGSLVLATTFTPANSGATGSTGEISWDGSYLYVCVAPNTWGRIAIDTTPF